MPAYNTRTARRRALRTRPGGDAAYHPLPCPRRLSRGARRSRGRAPDKKTRGARPPAARTTRTRPLRLLMPVPLIAGHHDIPDAIRQRGGVASVDFAAPQPKLMTDIPKLRAGAVGGQFWAAYVPVTTLDSGPHPAVYALEQIDLIKRLCTKYPRDLAMAYRAADVERNFKAGKSSCLIALEGGHDIDNSLGALRMFAARG